MSDLSVDSLPHPLQDLRHGQVERADDSNTFGANPTPSTASLPRADGGTKAWLFLLGAFAVEMVLWGFPFSFGVLQNYYSTHEPFDSHPAGISAVGTTCSGKCDFLERSRRSRAQPRFWYSLTEITGIMYLAAPLGFAFFQRWPQHIRKCSPIGLAIVVLAIALSSFARKVWHLILTQGVLYAFGGGLLYYPIFIFIDEWFIRRKGFAYGIIWAGSGCGGLSGPLVLNWGLSRYGVATFLRGWSLALLILIGPLLYFVKPRIPISRIHTVPRASFLVGFNFVKTRTFWYLQFGNIVQGLGYFIPALYLPSYARYLGLSTKTGSLMVSILNTASVPGVVFLSALCDRTNVTNVVLISAGGSTLAILLLWGFSNSIPMLAVFAIFYGFFAGGFTSTYAGTVKELRQISTGADLGSIFGLLSAGRGIGNVICGPISEAILNEDGWAGKALFAYGSQYGPLIVFTGATAALTLTPWVTKRMHFF